MAVEGQGFLRRWGWLLAALGLLLLAAIALAPPPARRVAQKTLAFPRYARPHEIERQEQRSHAPPRERRGDAGVLEVPARPDFDPMHVALSGGELALVIEAGVLKDSPIGRKLLACLSPAQLEGLGELEGKLGFRPLERIERIGLAGGSMQEEPVLLLSGDFTGFDPKRFGDEAKFESYGRHTELASGEASSVALWDERVLLIGKPQGVLLIVEKLEGNSPVEDAFPSSEAYGEVYGRMSGAALSQLLPEQFRERVGQAAERVLLHMDATDDLLMVAEVRGDAAQVKDLGTALAGALAMGRLHAVQQQETLLAELLDQSRVIPGQAGFQLEMALPLSAIEDQLGECARQNSPP